MKQSKRFEEAVTAIDEANRKDPNREKADGREIAKELLYSERMTEWLKRMAPDAAEELRLAARAQHIERWVIPREEYPMDRRGYKQWRNKLMEYHAGRTEEILREAGYDDKAIERVRKLVMKKGIKTDPEVQLLEDVICLVFLDYYFDEFAREHNDEKLVSILQKTWAKMSEQGRKMAQTIEISPNAERLIGKALAG
ncbi:MAG: DUF4202 domain-containing protein [Balneolaceae bacterium]